VGGLTATNARRQLPDNQGITLVEKAMRHRSGFLLLVAVSSALIFTSFEVEAQVCGGCYRPANPKDRNPDRRADRPDSLEPSVGRDSSSRPTLLPGIGSDSRDYVPPPEVVKSAPGDVAPDEKLPPPPNS